MGATEHPGVMDQPGVRGHYPFPLIGDYPFPLSAGEMGMGKPAAGDMDGIPVLGGIGTGPGICGDIPFLVVGGMDGMPFGESEMGPSHRGFCAGISHTDLLAGDSDGMPVVGQMGMGVVSAGPGHTDGFGPGHTGGVGDIPLGP